MRFLRRLAPPLVTFALLLAGCSDGQHLPTEQATPNARSQQGGSAAAEQGPYAFDPPIYDIEALPNGNILVPVSVAAVTDPSPGESTTTIHEIRAGGKGGVREYGEVTTPAGAPVNGLASRGRGSLWAAQGGQDLAVSAGLLHVTPGGERLVGDIEAFEIANDPDAFAVDPDPEVEGDEWKNPACEWAGAFTGGPQSNPYHLAAVSGGAALVADAAGNSLLRVDSDGRIEVVAVFTPPTTDGSLDPTKWMMHPPVRTGDEDPEGDVVEPCYAQPVPNSVAVGPDGDIFVGELTGLAQGAPFGAPTDRSRVWRIEAGTEDAVCPSADCELAVEERFTSIIDLAFGPDGGLYVVEYDENSWLSVVVPAIPTRGGTVNRCDVSSGSCSVAEVGGETLDGLTNPAAVAFDREGALWLLEDNLGIDDGRASVRRVGR